MISGLFAEFVKPYSLFKNMLWALLSRWPHQHKWNNFFIKFERDFNIKAWTWCLISTFHLAVLTFKCAHQLIVFDYIIPQLTLNSKWAIPLEYYVVHFCLCLKKNYCRPFYDHWSVITARYFLTTNRIFNAIVTGYLVTYIMV